MDYRGVIFDVDGTLVDSNPAHTQSWLQALEEFGVAADVHEVERAIGMGGDKMIPAFTPWSAEEARGQELAARRGEIFKSTYFAKLNAFKGARLLVQRLYHQEMKLAVASSAQEDELNPLLDLVGIRDLLQQKTSSADARKSKPDPDIVAVALSRLGLKAEEVIMVGDTPYDLEAAARLGVASMAFLTGIWSRNELGQARWIFENPADLLGKMGTSTLNELLSGDRVKPGAERRRFTFAG
ncbi:HAD family hydrolase [bacterium]|nr:HAD family hydrolase [bacterium]